MKRIIFLMIIGFFQIKTITSSVTSDLSLLQPLKQAEKALGEYIKTASAENIKNLLEYMKYYRSWYQAVTPAPYKLYEKLTLQDHALIQKLKEIAQTFTHEKKTLPGATTLSAQGDIFYQRVIKTFKSLTQ